MIQGAAGGETVLSGVRRRGIQHSIAAAFPHTLRKMKHAPGVNGRTLKQLKQRRAIPHK